MTKIKVSLSEFTPKMRMFLLLHECAHQQQSEIESKWPRPIIDYKALREEYFKNFPYDEAMVRQWLLCEQRQGWFKHCNIETDALSELISAPDDRSGIRIQSFTIGEGTHLGGYIVPHEIPVKENEVAITYNTASGLAGGCFTDIMKKENEQWKIISRETHMRS